MGSTGGNISLLSGETTVIAEPTPTGWTDRFITVTHAGGQAVTLSTGDVISSGSAVTKYLAEGSGLTGTVVGGSATVRTSNTTDDRVLRALYSDWAAPLPTTSLGFYLWAPDRITATSTTIATQNLRLTYFRAPVTQAITQIVTVPGTLTSPTGYTYAGYGIYQEESDGALTLLGKYEDTGSPPTTIYDTSQTARTNTLTTTVNFTRGRRYAAGPLVVYTGGTIQLVMHGLDPGGTVLRNECNLGAGSRLGVLITGGSSLPSSISNATLAAASGSWVHAYCRFVP